MSSCSTAVFFIPVNRQYIGDPIDCIVEEIPNNVMDTYCWIHSTFSVPNDPDGIEGENRKKTFVSAFERGNLSYATI